MSFINNDHQISGGNMRYSISSLIFLLVILTTAVLSCKKENDSTVHQHKETEYQTAIIHSPYAYVRISPLLFSARVTELERGEMVSIIERSAEKSWVGSKADYWYHIKMKNKTTGWIYGSSLKLVDSSSGNADTLLKELAEKDAETLKKELHGKWWSVNSQDTFTNQVLELFENSKYKSYYRDHEKNAIDGLYSIDSTNSMISFDKGTTFNTQMKYVKRGRTYCLFSVNEKNETEFKKISNELDITEKAGEPAAQSPEENADADKAE